MALVVARRHDVLVLALDDHELPLHLVRRDAAAAVLVRMVEEPGPEQETRDDQGGDRRDQGPLHEETLAPVGEEEGEADRYEGADAEEEPDRRRDRAVRLAEPLPPAVGPAGAAQRGGEPLDPGVCQFSLGVGALVTIGFAFLFTPTGARVSSCRGP